MANPLEVFKHRAHFRTSTENYSELALVKPDISRDRALQAAKQLADWLNWEVRFEWRGWAYRVRPHNDLAKVKGVDRKVSV